MTQSMHPTALFEGLVLNEEGEPAAVAYVGSEPHYVILEGDFRRHVEAEYVDRQVIEWLQGQVSANRDMVTQGTMEMLGQDDLFTKAMIDSSIDNMDDLMQHGLPEDARIWLGMLGFKIVVNFHGDVVEINAPTQEIEDD